MIDDLVKKLQKNEDHEVTLLGDENSPCIVREWISTGCLALDTIMGGGVPLGRIVEIYGGTSSGKSLVAAQISAVAQAQDIIVLYIDTERAVSIDVMKAVGVNVDTLIYASPETIEEVFNLMEKTILGIKELGMDKRLLIVWDSIAATTTKEESSNEYGKSTMGIHARHISQGLRKFNRFISKHNAAAVFINQTRQKIGVMFGDDEATFGGNAVGFYSSIRLRLKQSAKYTVNNEVIGIGMKAEVVKNKVAMPFRRALLPIYFGIGIDDDEATFNYMKDADLFNQNGSWYSLVINEEEVKFQKSGWSDVYEEHFDDIVAMVVENG